jgi:hypothetical protein
LIPSTFGAFKFINRQLISDFGFLDDDCS